MDHISLLPVIIFLPLIGAAAVLCIRGDERVATGNSRHVALFVASCTLALIVYAGWRFALNDVGVQFVYGKMNNPALPFAWRFGLDGLSLVFLTLNAFFVLCALFMVRRTMNASRSAAVMLLLTQSFVSGALCSRNLFQFFLFYEGAFIPLFLLMALWGTLKDEKVFFKQYFYFFLSVVLFFFGLLFLYGRVGTLDIDSLAAHRYTLAEQKTLLGLFLPAFAINLPLFPFHKWFKQTQTEAPLSLMLMISGVVSKLALYGMMVFVLPLAVDALRLYALWLVGWAVFSMVYASVAVFSNPNLKQKIVYVHMMQAGFLCAGLFAFMPDSVEAALAFCVTQGIVFTAVLLVLSFLFERLQTNETSRLSGLMTEIPLYAPALFVALCCYAALPGTPLFLNAFLMLNRLFDVSVFVGGAALVSGVLIVVALLAVFSQIMLGERQQTVFPYADIRIKERILFLVLGVLMVYLTLSPQHFLPYIDAAARGVMVYEKTGAP